ncbi:hypothetical protein [Acinetobacter piscicola]|uniref:hypothetical protein n=1 Tax=Acinetobacter piscicola TaxID=2006115 RepID=UPI00101E9523|nr:hypothetical protein [Acinetobacter piscicola]RYL27740.1 hypothetical protein EWP19_05970 [Acinetobacter piscicola]
MTFYQYQIANYYSLEEVADYFNQKYKSSIFSKHSILKQIIAFRIPTHIYCNGFNVDGFYDFKNLISEDERLKDELYGNKNLQQKESEATELMNSLLSSYCRYEGVWAEISRVDLIQIQMAKSIIIYSFPNLVPFDYSDKATNIFESLQVMNSLILDNLINSNAYPFFFKKYVRLINQFMSNKNIVLYTNNNELSEVFPKPHNDLEDKASVFNSFNICQNDIVILKNNLLILEQYLTGEKTFRPQFSFESKKELKRTTPRGKSIKKEYAQNTAKAFASFFWSEDFNKSIKIKDMALKVFVALKQTEYLEQLPDQPISIKEWIKDIAPEYSREAGRPKEI